MKLPLIVGVVRVRVGRDKHDDDHGAESDESRGERMHAGTVV